MTTKKTTRMASGWDKKPAPKGNDEAASQQDIAVALHNAQLLACRPSSRNVRQTEEGLRKLRAVALATVQPLLDIVEEEGLTYEEVVYTLGVAAYYTQLKYVMLCEEVPKDIKARRR